MVGFIRPAVVNEPHLKIKKIGRGVKLNIVQGENELQIMSTLIHTIILWRNIIQP